MRTCDIDGCEDKHKALGLCWTHYRRSRSGLPMDFVRQRGSSGTGIDASGYVISYVDRRKIYEHRRVMEEILGRKLTSGENVHHINGQRSDNRPENLELWSTSQPSGQRVSDKITFANEIIAKYGKDPRPYMGPGVNVR